MMNILDFQAMKSADQKITLVTCYDFWSAKIIAKSDVDCILVGDSAAMVMHGHDTTLPATVETIALHTKAVAKGAGKKFIIADMPFLSYRKGLAESMQAVQTLMQSGGAHAIKLEGGVGNYALIEHIVESGVPVMGHLGLTPQSVHQLGGFRAQAKTEHAAMWLLEQAKALQQAGCFAIVLECVPSAVAKNVTEQLTIPTIGIGAGPHTSGQVLVLQDLLGVDEDVNFTFVKKYLDGFNLIKDALNRYNSEVKTMEFPLEKEHAH